MSQEASPVRKNARGSITALAVYGVKCDISKAEVEKDAMEFISFLDGLKPEAPFTEEDCKSALECFDEKYVTFPRVDLEKITGIEIPPSHRDKDKRLKQKEHLELARFSRDIRQRMNGTKWTDNSGRPDKAEIVKQWRLEHSEGRKADCIKDTGLSKPTVYKWWRKE